MSPPQRPDRQSRPSLRSGKTILEGGHIPPQRFAAPPYYYQTYLLSTGEAVSEASVGGDIPKEDPLQYRPAPPLLIFRSPEC